MADERIRLELDLNQFTASAKEGTDSLKTMAIVADQNVTPALKKVDDAAHQAARSKQQFGQTVLYASYAVQDFTNQLGTRGLAGAFAAIQNNIPQILIGLGLGSGLTGVLSVAAVALGAFSDKLVAMPEDAKKAAKALEDLKEKADKLRESPSTKEKQTAGKFSDYLQMMDRDTISGGIQATLTEEAQQKAQEAAESLAAREMIPGTEAYAARMLQRGGRRLDVAASVRERMKEQQAGIKQRTDELLVGLSEGRAGAVRDVTGMARRRGGFFPRGLADDLDSFSPEAEAAADAEEERVAREGDRLHTAGERRRGRAAGTRELNDRGRENESRTTALAQQNAIDRVNESRRLARDASRAYEQNQRNAARQRQGFDREDASLRGGISHIQEQIGRAQEREMKGLATHMETQQIVFGLQSQMSMLQAKLNEITQNNRRLQERNSILQRGR